MAYDPAHPPTEVLAFLAERHLALLTTFGRDGRPHVTAVGFTFDPGEGLVRIITSGDSQKAVNARRGGRAAVGQVDGGRWLSLEGPVQVSDDPVRVARAVADYARRYRPPRENPKRVTVEITVERILGRV
ncbi:MAG: pyridoxamine 5'-phosphate oxidase family protein [Acidimicrobiia bacterium]